MGCEASLKSIFIGLRASAVETMLSCHMKNAKEPERIKNNKTISGTSFNGNGST